jgi:hypothetical protein
MKITFLAGLFGLCLALPVSTSAWALGDDTRWVTFKTDPMPGYGPVLHQIDRVSVRQEGPYKTFSTRVWVVKEKQPLAFGIHEQLFFLSRKYAVDCAQRRFGSRFIDSNNPKDIKTSLQAMKWQSLDKVPAVGGAVCGGG